MTWEDIKFQKDISLLPAVRTNNNNQQVIIVCMAIFYQYSLRAKIHNIQGSIVKILKNNLLNFHR